MRIWIDGRWADGKDASVSAADRGFMYGEGIYESLRTYDGALFAPAYHYERFRRSADILGLPVEIDFSRFESTILEGLEGIEKDCTVRVVLTSGDGKIPSLLIYVMELQAPSSDLYSYGVDVGISRSRKPSESFMPSLLKTISHANLMLARRGKEDFYEILLLNGEGFVAEGLTSNLFLVENEKLVTPSIQSGILDGITRKVVTDLAGSLGVTVEERTVNVDELFNCSEIFLTRTSAGIIPVRKIESRLLFENEPGGITELLMENFRPYIFQRQDLW